MKVKQINTGKMLKKYETENVSNYFINLVGYGVEFIGENIDTWEAELIEDSEQVLDQLQYNNFLHIEEKDLKRHHELIVSESEHFGIQLIVEDLTELL